VAVTLYGKGAREVKKKKIGAIVLKHDEIFAQRAPIVGDII